MSPRKIAGVLLGFGGVATMIGPSLALQLRQQRRLPSSPASPRRLSYALAAVWARRFRRQGISPLSVTTGQLTGGRADDAAGVDARRPALDPRLPAAQRVGARSSLWPVLHRLRLRALFPADRDVPARPMPCW